ncbi:LuxR family transcriptional regulator [Burkholderia sp. Bp9017]|uniref:helix-turn-helix transcriptional regulator n=1 Tax=unclassified Burkholderia TaxID=2613784 RepID=UPI000F5E847C|nr:MULTISPECIES: autoinducer binding domain-containing protein [unclassified Burkholderia]RQZ31586.1 LuxR family transcriptional regulator [Burkholderia sp. Bp9017]RQZ37718.1 LuxR family transcriptional regulator [Burkholderia sp. Bp9016]
MRTDAQTRWLVGLEEIAQAQDRIALNSLTRALLTPLGVERFVFIHASCEGPEELLLDTQILMGCDERWLKTYRERKWFVTDPGLNYARRNFTPATATTIPHETDGQRIFRQHDIAYGFRSKLVVPAHLPVLKRLGVLYVGSDADTWEGEPDLFANKILFRMLALELLDWFHNQLRRDMTEALGLTERHTSILNLLRRGYSASHIAHELNLKVPTIYAYYKQLNQKFSVNHITRVVEQAAHLGLLEH